MLNILFQVCSEELAGGDVLSHFIDLDLRSWRCPTKVNHRTIFGPPDIMVIVYMIGMITC